MNGEVVHRLGVAVLVIVGLWWLVRSFDTARRRRRLRARLTTVLALAAERPRRHFLPLGVVRRWLPVAGAVCAGWVLVGGLVGLLLGLAAGVGAWQWLRRARRAGGDPSEAYDAAAAARQLPLAADLLAACITAGASPVVAARAVGEALGGPVGERLARGAAEARLGGEPAAAWRSLAALPGAGALARLLERADESGVPAASPVARLAADARSEWGRAATERARRAAVMVTAPVGLCFLPAFIAVGVLPVVIGLADGLLGGSGP
ncbi:type II secretion system F family protein [Streptomyces sp. MB09-02B]|uniref:type II secretion system F family protein n=1 Tax=Streptomyces sp. MB09-02B TaxID=3028667 RepID=UPI0029B6E6D9|nr:type II secretion system F family protein [Streptomyces sp. MB09-02B]MDX3643359.1 type II secretion system F family protein [Streptomyces sp. MB09-02B]